MAERPSSQSANISCPLDSDKYLASPLTTLLDSIHDPQSECITLHDLTEAYATLSRRVRLQATAILASEKTHPALTPIRTHSSSLALCILRDVGRCLLNPLSIFSQQDSASDDSSVFEEGAERAQAFATLSHHALVFLSDVFSLMPLMQHFSADHLEGLLREVLLILSSHALPTPNAKKTRSLAIWILSSHCLPSDVLLSSKGELEKVVTRIVQEEIDGYSYKPEGFKVFSTLLCSKSFGFTNALLSLYQSILSSAMEDTLNIQIEVVKALGRIANLKLDSPDAQWSKKVAAQTRSFIQSQATKHKISQEGSLQQVLSASIKKSDGHWGHKGPLWALLLIASLICLSDADLFAHSHSLKLFLSILAQASGHKRAYARTLHPYTWTCLVWCYSRLLASTQNSHNGQELADIRKRAFLVLRQELKGGIAIALVAALLRPLPGSQSFPTSNEISSALEVIRDLLSSSKEPQVQEAVRIMGRLVSGVNSSTTVSSWDNTRGLSNMVARELFAGSLLDSSESQINILCGRLPKPGDCLIYPLTEHRILEHWDQLVELWIQCINYFLSSDIEFAEPKQYLDRLLSIWQSLLLVRSQLVSGSAILSLSPQTIDQVISIVTGFITGTEDTATQLRQLRLTQKLWSVLKQSYGSQWLAPLAEAILSVILGRKYAFHREEIKLAWGKVCADMASVGLPNFLHAIFGRSESRSTEVQRRLWMTMANGKTIISGNNNWEEILSFLVIPVGFWTIDLQELDVWNGLFNKALNIAGVPPDKVVKLLLNKLGESGIRVLLSSPGITSVLLPHITFDRNSVLDVELLRTVGMTLAKLYPPAPEDHILAIPMLSEIARLVSSTDEANITQLLCALRDGLCPWIKDSSKILLEHEHSTIVHNIYCPALVTLANVPPSAETLKDLSPLFVSAFERIGHPPIGPLAFEHFWRSTYHRHEALASLVPDDLRTCLKAWSDHCGDSLGEGMSSLTDSQSTTRSLVPDSQSPEKAAATAAAGDTSPYLDSNMIDGSSHLAVLEERSPVTGTSQETTPKTASRLLSRWSNAPDSGGEDEALEIPQSIAGIKRPSPSSTVPIPKRRRTETNVDNDIEAPLLASHPSNPPDGLDTDSRSELFSGSSLFPLPPGRQPFQTPEHRSRRRVQSPTPGNVIPESSSPAAFPVQRDTGNSKGMRMGDGYDEIVEDSTEMDQFPLSIHKGLYSTQSLPAKRMQSEPIFETDFPSRPTPLRRTHTTSERLGALERAYTLVAQAEGGSQIAVEELAQAARIAHEIGAKLNEQITNKLRKGS